MQENLIYTSIGMAIIFTASIGLASTMTTSGVVSIGASDDAIPPLDDIEVGQITWQRTGGEYYRLRVEATNTDSFSHTYEMCTIWADGASYSADAGDPADCASRNINAGATRNTNIPVTNTTPAHDGTTYIYIEKTS